MPQLPERGQHLFHLIDLGSALIALYVDTWIAPPWRFEYHMASTCLSRFSEECLTYFLQIAEPNISRLISHLHDYFVQLILGQNDTTYGTKESSG